MKLLIFGASGATGVHLVKQALAAGREVTAFVRDVNKLRINHPMLSRVQGNVVDPGAVQSAVHGHDVVLSAIGANQVFKFDPVVVKGLAHIVDAMTSLQVNRLIYLSTPGVRATRNNGGFMIRALAPTLLRHEINGHEQREEIIQNSGLNWTIVRAPILTKGALTESYKTGSNLRSNHFVTRLSRADVAHCMLDQVNEVQKRKKIRPVRAYHSCGTSLFAASGMD